MRVNIRTNIRGVERELRRLRERGLDFAYKRALDETAAKHKLHLIREWRRRFKTKGSRIKNAIRIKKAFVRQGHVKPALVFSIVEVQGVMRKQIGGGRQIPWRGGRWFIPSSRLSEGRIRGMLKRLPTFEHDGKLYARQKSGRDNRGRKGRIVYLGAVQRSIDVPRRFDYDRQLDRVVTQFEISYLRALRREIHNFHERAARARIQ